MPLKRIAICPGSFDPVTIGHLDIMSRASRMFDEVIVLVLSNPSKSPSFSIEERIQFLKKVTGSFENLRIDTYGGLLAEYAKVKGACAIVKGLRAVSDFESEFQMALVNKKLNPETETIFLTTDLNNMYLSSSIVKQVAMFGGDISDFVPEPIRAEVEKRLCQRGE